VNDVERALGVSAEYRVPSDIAIPQAVNRGVPVVLDKPRAPAALALRAVAESFFMGSAPAPQPVAAPEPETPSENRRRRWR
jgi:MinD-like ATPase involved in chromosome partitioning or flagellar assembly